MLMLVRGFADAQESTQKLHLDVDEAEAQIHIAVSMIEIYNEVRPTTPRDLHAAAPSAGRLVAKPPPLRGARHRDEHCHESRVAARAHERRFARCRAFPETRRANLLISGWIGLAVPFGPSATGSESCGLND